MTERLRRVLTHVDELPKAAQDDLAVHIEEMLGPELVRPKEDFAGILSDLPDDAVDVLDQLRHEAIPTPMIEDFLCPFCWIQVFSRHICKGRSHYSQKSGRMNSRLRAYRPQNPPARVRIRPIRSGHYKVVKK